MARVTKRMAQQERIAKAKADAQATVATGVCPQCGTPLIRNLALAGWWQCGAFGADTHRQERFRALPHCDFQCFTE